MTRSESEKTVLSKGFGKAGNQLHLPSWLENNYDIVAHDTSSSRLDPTNFPENARQAYEAGQLTTVDSLAELTQSPDVVDIVTSSKRHTEALEQVLEAIKPFDTTPSAWLIEKPVVSSHGEAARLSSLLESGDVNEGDVFVNENYNASLGVEELKRRIEAENANGNVLQGIDVVFYKNRVPDVLANRFTDPTLGAYGIELPHQLAVAYNLAGVEAGDRVDIVQNDYYTNVHGIEHSEATYTVLKTSDDVEIRLSQGLGPFTINVDGEMDENDNPGIVRYAHAYFANGRTARILFDPAPGVERFHSIVAWEDEEGDGLIIPDNTVQRVIGSVAAYVASGERELYTTALSARNALNYATTLLDLREHANDK